MKTGVIVSGILGLLAAVGLVVWNGAQQVLGITASVGWGLLWVSLFHFIPSVFSAMGWRDVSKGDGEAGSWLFVYWRWLRESSNNLLPFGQLGGEVVAVRLMTFRGWRTANASASVVADLTMETVTQFLFTFLGLALLPATVQGENVVETVLVFLAVAFFAIGAFLFMQLKGGFRMLENGLLKLSEKFGWEGLSDISGLHDTLVNTYRDRTALLKSTAAHLLSWIAGTGEVWLALHFMGFEVTLADAMVLECLGHAIRTAAFAVPGGWGVQEGGFLVLAGLVGLPPEIGLALSLVKRGRELILGLPGLALWHWEENRRWQEKKRDAADSPPPK